MRVGEGEVSIKQDQSDVIICAKEHRWTLEAGKRKNPFSHRASKRNRDTLAP